MVSLLCVMGLARESGGAGVQDQPLSVHVELRLPDDDDHEDRLRVEGVGAVGPTAGIRVRMTCT